MRRSRAFCVIGLVLACTSSAPRDDAEPRTIERTAEVEQQPPQTIEAPPVPPEPVQVATPIVEPAPIAPPIAPPVQGTPWRGLQPMHATARGGVFEVEVLVDLLREGDQRKLRKLAGREIKKRTTLAVEPGAASLPKLMRPTSLALVTTEGVVMANVVEVMADDGPSGARGILVTDRPANKGAHAIALGGAPKNPKAQLHAVRTKPVDASHPVLVAALAHAKAAAEFTTTESVTLASLAGLRRTRSGAAYLLDVELEEGGVHGIFFETKSGDVVPLFDPIPEGRLRPLGAVNLDGDGNDELLARLDAFEGTYVQLFEWDAKADRYAAVTIAGDGT